MRSCLRGLHLKHFRLGRVDGLGATEESAMTGPSPYLLVRPYLWIALAAFLCGFAGYLALGLRGVIPATDTAVSPISAPWVSGDDAGPARAI
jgi:hypothetical protein